MSEEIKVTKEMIRKLADNLCGDAKEAVEKAFPEVFEKTPEEKEEWEDITKRVKLQPSNDYPGNFYVEDPKGRLLFWTRLEIIDVYSERKGEVKIEDGRIFLKK